MQWKFTNFIQIQTLIMHGGLVCHLLMTPTIARVTDNLGFFDLVLMIIKFHEICFTFLLLCFVF